MDKPARESRVSQLLREARATVHAPTRPETPGDLGGPALPSLPVSRQEPRRTSHAGLHAVRIGHTGAVPPPLGASSSSGTFGRSVLGSKPLPDVTGPLHASANAPSSKAPAGTTAPSTTAASTTSKFHPPSPPANHDTSPGRPVRQQLGASGSIGLTKRQPLGSATTGLSIGMSGSSKRAPDTRQVQPATQPNNDAGTTGANGGRVSGSAVSALRASRESSRASSPALESADEGRGTPRDGGASAGPAVGVSGLRRGSAPHIAAREVSRSSTNSPAADSNSSEPLRPSGSLSAGTPTTTTAGGADHRGRADATPSVRFGLSRDMDANALLIALTKILDTAPIADHAMAALPVLAFRDSVVVQARAAKVILRSELNSDKDPQSPAHHALETLYTLCKTDALVHSKLLRAEGLFDLLIQIASHETVSLKSKACVAGCLQAISGCGTGSNALPADTPAGQDTTVAGASAGNGSATQGSHDRNGGAAATATALSPDALSAPTAAAGQTTMDTPSGAAAAAADGAELRRALITVGAVPAVQSLLDVAVARSGEHNAVRVAMHAMTTLRHLTNTDTAAPLATVKVLHTVLNAAMTSALADDLQTARSAASVVSKIVFDEDLARRSDAENETITAMIQLILAHPGDAHVVSRATLAIAVTLHENPAALAFTAELEGAVPTLTGALRAAMENTSILTVPAGRELLTNLLRAVTNATADRLIGATVARDPLMASGIVQFLGELCIEDDNEIVLHVLLLLGNLSYYWGNGSNNDDSMLSNQGLDDDDDETADVDVQKKTNSADDSGSVCPFDIESVEALLPALTELLFNTVSTDAVMEAARIVGNLTAHPMARTLCVHHKIDDICATLVAVADPRVRYNALGVVCNFSSSPQWVGAKRSEDTTWAALMADLEAVQQIPADEPHAEELMELAMGVMHNLLVGLESDE